MPELKDYSRRDLAVTGEPTGDYVSLGCLQRIANAVEIVAKNSERMVSNHKQLENDLRWYRDEADRLSQEIDRLKHSRAGYMAALTKLRKETANAARTKTDTDKSDPRRIELSENIQ